MKKTLLIAAAALICAAAVLSCSKPSQNNQAQDNSSNPSSQTGEDALSGQVKVIYRFVTSEQVMEFFDFKIVYWDLAQKKDVTIEKAASAFVEKTIEAQLPCKMSISLEGTLKEGKTLDEIRSMEKFNYMIPITYHHIIFYGTSGNVYSTSGTLGSETPEDFKEVKGSKVADDYENGRFSKTFTVEFDENGTDHYN